MNTINSTYTAVSLKNQLSNDLQFIGQLEENVMHITAYIIDVCNYACSYCYNKMPRSLAILDLNSLYKICNEFAQNGLKCQLSLIGGEPTLHPGLLEFCKRIHEIKDISIEIYTNGHNSNIISELTSYCKLIITFHMQMSNFQAFYELVLKLSLIEHKYQIQVRIMLEHKNEYEIIQFYKDIKNKFYDIDIILCAIDDNIYAYDYDMQKTVHDCLFLTEKLFVKHSNKPMKQLIVDDLYKDPSVENSLSFKNWLCNAGYNYLYVHCNGNIYQCQAFFENNMNPISYINKFSMHNLKKHICALNKCICCELVIDKKRLYIK